MLVCIINESKVIVIGCNEVVWIFEIWAESSIGLGMQVSKNLSNEVRP